MQDLEEWRFKQTPIARTELRMCELIAAGYEVEDAYPEACDQVADEIYLEEDDCIYVAHEYASESVWNHAQLGIRRY